MASLIVSALEMKTLLLLRMLYTCIIFFSFFFLLTPYFSPIRHRSEAFQRQFTEWF